MSVEHLTEDNDLYLKYVFDLAIRKGFPESEAVKLSEMALFKKLYEGISYSDKYERLLKQLLIQKETS